MNLKNVEDVYSLSPMQQGMLFHYLYAPGSGTYIEQIGWTLSGNINVAAFEQAWAQVVARHSILRTCFFWEGLEQPLQVVRRKVELKWERDDWRALSANEQKEQLGPYLEMDRQHGFDLGKAPLMRVAQIRLSDISFLCIWTYHHLLLDGWSVSLLFKELFTFYEALCQGEPLEIGKPRPYRDYIAWLQQQDITQAEAHWRGALSGFDTPTPLGVDRALRKKVDQEEAIQTQRLFLSRAMTDRLRLVARQHNLTLNTLVQGAWALLLSRYSGEPEVVFGSVVSGRTPALAGVESMIGLFINTIPVRASVAVDALLMTWLRELQAANIAGQQYEYTQLKHIKAWSDVPDDQSLFDSIVTFENLPEYGAPNDPNGSATVHDVFRVNTKTGYLLTVGAIPMPEMELRITCDSRRFDASFVTRMLLHLETLLTGMTIYTDRRLSDLPLLTDVERHQLLIEWNNTKSEDSSNDCIHKFCEAQAQLTPDVVAVVFEEHRLTYQQINARANQLAHHLRRMGVGPEVRVAICLERSIEMVVALLGVLKAGGAYIPLDAAYPPERLAFIIQDAEAAVLITMQHLVAQLPAHRATVLSMDAEGDAIAQESADDPTGSVTPDNLAYVIYTSGSTGKPKGVAVEHRQLVNYLNGILKRLEPSARTSFAMASTFAADLGNTVIYPSLCSGGCLHIISQERALNPEAMADYFHSHSIDCLKIVPSHFAGLLSASKPEWIIPRQRLVLGGEATSWELIEKLHELALGCRVFNHYGPTETTVGVATHELKKVRTNNLSATVPIGRPIANAQIYLLDRCLNPTPIGIVGELYIGGECLTRGYLNHPEYTAERFIPNPFSNQLGARLYKTGDLARYLPDGEIEFLGRLDYQVKVRGFRIELGEIEAALANHPDVWENVVTVREDTSSERRIVAYLVANRRRRPSTSKLWSFLKEKLPGHMIPAAFVMMDRLPLTPNGKIDRKALPSPDGTRTERQGGFVPPRTRVEKVLARIWSKILRIDQIGVHDNFFASGGDSILSLQVVSKAYQEGLRLTARDLFQYPTIAALAAVTCTDLLSPADQGVITGPVPLTPIQHWFFEQHSIAPHHFNQAILLEARLRLNALIVERVVEHLLAHHDALRLRFTLTESGWEQFNAGLNKLTFFSHVDLSGLSQEDQLPAMEMTASQLQSSLNLASGPLLRVVFFDYGEHRPSHLLLIIHHLVMDGVSWRIFLEDFETAYNQMASGAQIKLPTKTTPFKKWAERLREYSQSVALHKEAAYWFSESQEKVCLLPTDFDGGINISASAASLSVSLNAQETRTLLQDVPKVYHTQINDALLTALAQSFAEWTGSRCLMLNLEGHGRESLFDDVDLTRTVGWFTSRFPVLLNLREAFSPGEALKTIKEQLRAIPRGGIGYGLLCYLREGETIAANLRAASQAEVSFNYLGQFDQVLTEASLFKLSYESIGPARSPQQIRSHLIEIDGSIVEGILRLVWTYSENFHRRSTIETLAYNLIEALRSLIAHCQSPEAGGHTPSDFPLAQLDQQFLDQLCGNAGRVEDIYPLSPMQAGMLFYTLYSPELRMYFEQLSFRLEGNIKVPAFEQAWQKIVDRHSSLRTAFIWEDLDEPVQVVYQRAPISLAQQDWRNLSSIEQQDKLEAFLDADKRLGFKLFEPPLMRISLIRLDEQSYQFIWSRHHLLMDGWSLPLLLKEAFSIYEALCRGKELNQQRERPYRDYIAWLQGRDMEKAESFWRKKLKGFTAPTPLRVDRTPGSSPGQEEVYAQQQVELPTVLTLALRSFTQHGLTLNTLVQGAWALLLMRYSAEEDVVFGATVAGRQAELIGIESMIGLFINTLPMRVQASREEPILFWLKDLQAQQAEMSQYEYSPLAQVQAYSDVAKGTLLFESIIVFENYPAAESLQQGFGNLKISNVCIFEKTNYPLTLVAAPGTELLLKLLYDGNRFDATTIGRMLAHLKTILEAIANDQEQRASDLSLLTNVERHQLLVEWNDTQSSYPTDLCFHQLFEIQVEHAPEVLAVTFENEELTYRELNVRANQVAHYLRRFAIGPEVRVGICVERSLDMVVGRLAILKAGGAYIPMDPTSPQERLAFMLEDAQVTLLLTQQRRLNQLPDCSAKVVCLDSDWHIISQESEANLANKTTPDNLAYVIYTSGSTGKPKGVEIQHGGFVNLVTWHNLAYNITPSDRKSQLAGLAFDASVWELWPYLATGASVHIPNEDTHSSWSKLLEWLIAKAITICFLPTPLAEVVLEDDWPNGLALRALLTGGDKLHRWPQKELPFHFVNKYGPTEATAVTTWAPLVSGTEINSSPPIGRPIANTQLYLLDHYLQPAPPGVPAELYIGGVGLARGYLNRPDLTAEKFIPNPFSDEPGARLYKTGDIARYLPDGNVDFLGRLDDQVKIRGFRIELGEIEAVLGRHPSVQEVVIIAREDIPNNKRLAAYVVAGCEPPPTTGELLSFLKDKLPDYMLPSTFVIMDELPLTPNGKVDRKSLPVPFHSESDAEGTFIAPSTPVEEVLAGIWAEALGLKRVSIHDNFFELGGDSILSIRIIARAKQKGIHLSLNQLFQQQTIAKLAEGLSQGQEDHIFIGQVPFTPAQRKLFEQGPAHPGRRGHAVLLEVQQPIDGSWMEQAAQHLAAQHDAFRLCSASGTADWQQEELSPDDAVHFTEMDLTALSEAQQRIALGEKANEMESGLSLTRGPLLEAAYFNFGANSPSYFLLIAHYLLVDSTSWRILLEDLEDGYIQLSQGESIKPSRQTISFRYWAKKLADHAQSSLISRDARYWLERFPRQLPSLPVDFHGGANDAASTCSLSTFLEAEETRTLLEVAATYHTEMEEVLLSALVQVFARWTGRPSLLIDLEYDGRNISPFQIDLSRTVGYFTTVIPAWLDMESTRGSEQSLKSVKEQLYLIKNVGLSYGLLRYLSRDTEVAQEIRSLPTAEVIFGPQAETTSALSLFQPCRQALRPQHDVQESRRYLFDIRWGFVEGRVRLSWTYNQTVHRPSTIEHLAESFREALRSLIIHYRAYKQGNYTPSDFPDADLNQRELDNLLSGLREIVNSD